MVGYRIAIVLNCALSGIDSYPRDFGDIFENSNQV